ncbi:MAG: acyltransferase [Nocardioidaceae bacterium]|nr:acyltransferase [Nocardioidaceae bacterium]
MSTEQEQPHGPHPDRVELRALTGLRAVAALAVVLSHTKVPADAPAVVRQLAAWGHIGVALFFMLSGFVLAYNYPDLRFRDGRRTLRFYAARVARVMPLYWAVIIFNALLFFVINHDQRPVRFVIQVLGLQAWGPDGGVTLGQYNGPGWSISVEIFLYLLFPLVVPLVAALYRRYGDRAMVTLIVVIALVVIALWLAFDAAGHTAMLAAEPSSAHRWLYRNPLANLLQFIVGIAAAHLLGSVRRMRADWVHHLVPVLVGGYILTFVTIKSQTASSPLLAAGSYAALWTIPFAILLLSLATGRGWLAKLLATAPMVSLGVASFALYLTHRELLRRIGFAKHIQEEGWRSWVALVLVVVILLLVAEGAHRYVEVPCRRWVIKLADRFIPRTPRAKVAQPPARSGDRADDADDDKVGSPA